MPRGPAINDPVRVNLKMPRKLSDAITIIAAKRGLSVSELVRKACIAFVREQAAQLAQEKAKQGAVAQEAQEA